MRESEEIEMQIRQISKECLYRKTDFPLKDDLVVSVKNT